MPFAALRCDSIYDIRASALADHAVRLVLADLDNTVARYGQPLPDHALLAWRDTLRAHGIALFVLSNSRRPNRVARFCAALDVPYLAHAGKPRPDGFRTAMARMGVPPAQTVMVGDQVFTDAWGAWRAGVPVFLVRPIRLAPNPGRALRFLAEQPIRLFIKKGAML